MKKRKFTLIGLLVIGGLLWTMVVPTLAQAIAPEEIMNRVDENEHIESARLEAELVIKDRGRETVKEMISYMRTDNQKSDSLSEFVNPRDRGTKYLKLGDDLWMYFPDAEDLVSISGHMLREGIMGSDFSYEDMLESDQLTTLYEFELETTEVFAGRDTYLLSARAKPEEKPSYHRRKLWVDQERFVILKEELYSRGDRLLKVRETKDIQEFDGRWFPMEMVMNDKLREDTETIYRITEIEFDYEIPEGKISLSELQ